jgi:hypothetical protein
MNNTKGFILFGGALVNIEQISCIRPSGKTWLIMRTIDGSEVASEFFNSEEERNDRLAFLHKAINGLDKD